MITAQHNLDSLNAIMPEYQRVSGLTTEQVLVKKGTDLTFQLRDRLRRLIPGAITADAEARLKSGGGIKVRDSIIRKVAASKGAVLSLKDRLKHTGGNADKDAAAAGRGLRGVRFGFNSRNKAGRTADTKGRSLWNLIVKREISAREAGKGYTAYAAMMRVKNLPTRKVIRHFGRIQQELANAALAANTEGGSLTFTFGGKEYQGQPVGITHALQQPKGQQAIADSLNAVRKDIGVYLARKHREAIQAAADRAASLARRVSK